MAQRKVRGAILLALSAAIGLGASSQVFAQTTPPASGATPPSQQDPLTVQNLIGDAVSLSNQDYPDVEKAIQRFKNGDAVGAREFLELAKQKYPKLPPTDLTLAKLYIYTRNGPQARAALEATVTAFPNDPEAYLLMADLAFSEGRTTEAHALFEKAAALAPKFNENEKRKKNFDIRVLAGLGAVHERRFQWKEAHELLAKWAQLDPDSAAAHTRLGVTLFHLKKTPEAFEEFKKAREIKTDSAHPYVALGQLYTVDKDIEKARQAFEKAYTEDQKNEATARAYAEWLIQQNELDKAQQVAAAMRQAAPESENAMMLDGIVSQMRGQPKAAEEALTKALSLNPANAGATNLLALILAESSNVSDQEKALRYAQVNADRFANSSQANITLAYILLKLGRTAESDAYLKKSVESGNVNADSGYLVAKILVQKGQRDNAKKALEEVLRMAGLGMFMYRKDAENLLKELGGTVPTPVAPGAAAAGGATPGATTVGGAPAPEATLPDASPAPAAAPAAGSPPTTPAK